MKKYFIILFFVFSFGQVSILDLNGQGKVYYSFDPASISIGDSWLFSSHLNNNTLNATSSLVGEKKSVIRMFTSFNKISVPNRFEQNNQSINLLNFTFPIANNSMLSFGISPLTKSDFSIVDEDFSFIPGNELSDPLAFLNRYNINGGISQFYIALATENTKSYSIGLKWNKLFGNQFIGHKNYTYSISFNQLEEATYTLLDSTYSETDRIYNGSNFDLDARYHLDEKSTIAFLASFSLPISIIQSYYVWWDAPNGQKLIISSDNKNFNLNKLHLRSFAIGYNKVISNNASYNIEWHYSNPPNYGTDYMILDHSSSRVNSLHAGLSQNFNLSQSNIINSVSLSIGTSIKQIELNNTNYYDINLSFGTSISYANNTNLLDLSCQFGNLINPARNIGSEQYININIGVVAGDFWFIKNRRKN